VGTNNSLLKKKVDRIRRMSGWRRRVLFRRVLHHFTFDRHTTRKVRASFQVSSFAMCWLINLFFFFSETSFAPKQPRKSSRHVRVKKKNDASCLCIVQ
jgi:hypothetical protein